jgi:hypothetical protein
LEGSLFDTKLSGESKVSHLNILEVMLAGNENVVGFDVSMNDAFYVHVGDCIEDGVHEITYLLL